MLTFKDDKETTGKLKIYFTNIHKFTTMNRQKTAVYTELHYLQYVTLNRGFYKQLHVGLNLPRDG